MRVKWASSGAYHSCWPPSVILGGPFSRIRGSFDELGCLALNNNNNKKLEHNGQLKKSGLELLQNPGCLSGEIMTQTNKRKAIETVRGAKSSKKL